jgi:hypothetical protein
MNMYTYTQARKKLADLLDEAKERGKVMIRRRDGSIFALSAEKNDGSPLNVEGVDTDISREDIVSAVRTSRKPR